MGQRRSSLPHSPPHLQILDVGFGRKVEVAEGVQPAAQLPEYATGLAPQGLLLVVGSHPGGGGARLLLGGLSGSYV